MRRRRHRTSIRRKLLRRTLLVALVPLLVTGAAGIGALVWLTGSGKASVSDSREELADEVISSDLSNRAAQLSRELAFFVIERVDDLRELGTDQLVSEAGSDDAAAVGDRLAAFAESHRDFTEITLAGPGGRIVASTDGAITGSVGREHWFEEATESGLDLTEASVGGDGLLSVRVAVGIDGGAALRAALDLSLVQRTADDIAGAASREVLVIDADGERIADTASGHDPDVILDPDGRVQLSKDLIAIQAMAFAGHERGTGALILSETSGGFSFLREDLSAAAAARGDALLADEAAEAFDWTVLVEQPTDVAFASLSKLEQLEND
ncbi:MAG: cache domain-containing protein, partial [Acidimicrobiales bacterium]